PLLGAKSNGHVGTSATRARDAAGPVNGEGVRLLDAKHRASLTRATSVLSGYKSNSVRWLDKEGSGSAEIGSLRALESGVLSNKVRLRICRISERLRSMWSSFLTMAVRTYTVIAIHT